MKLLALETATEACSVAVYADGDIRERHEIAPRKHAEYTLPWAEQLLADAGLKKSQLDAIAVSRGPGAFTGVRLAIALAQGIALALDKPVIAVSTLRVLAAQAQGEPASKQGVLAAIDARMGEIYAASFKREGDDVIATSDEIVIAPGNYELPEGNDWLGVGTGFAAENNALQSKLASRFVSIDANALPHAADLARLAALDYAAGKALAPELIEPAYLRNNVALTIAEQKALHGEKK